MSKYAKAAYLNNLHQITTINKVMRKNQLNMAHRRGRNINLASSKNYANSAQPNIMFSKERHNKIIKRGYPGCTGLFDRINVNSNTYIFQAGII